MKHRILKRFILFSVCTPMLFCACGRQAAAQLPPPEEEPIYPILPVPTPRELPDAPPPEAEETPSDPQVWDVSDVDTSYIDPTKKLISFTFDDAPSKTFENILAVFAANNEARPDGKASATFFCNGHFLHASTLHSLRLATLLHMELGNHTFSHADLKTLAQDKIAWEIDRTDEILATVDGKTRHLFRAPFGNVDEQVKQTVQTPIIDWTIDTLDWTGVSAQTIYDTVWSKKYAGAIVLMHDGYENTVDALKMLLPDLYEAGYQVVSVSALAKAHDCPLKTGGVYIRARKQKTGV